MKVYKPNARALFIIFGIMALSIPVVMLFYPPYTSNEICGSLGFAAMSILLGVITCSAKVTIIDNKKLKYSFCFFYKKQANIDDIYKITRATNLHGLGAAYGYQMVIYYREHSKNKFFVINENPFEKKVIAKFITEIQKINNNIELNRYYQRINDQPNSSHFSDFSSKQKIGLFGVVASMVVFFIILETESLFIPVTMLFLIFCLALFITNKIKKAIITILAVVLFFAIIALITSIK